MAGAAMIASLASCSTEKVEVKPDVITPDMAGAYAKIAVSSPKTASTKADDVMTADELKAIESEVKTVNLAFYDEYGTYVGTATQVSDATITNDETPNVSDKYARVFKLSLIEGANAPTQVVAFINTDLKNNNLDVLGGGIKFPAESLYDNTKGDNNTGFVMTNSGYFNKDKEWVIAAPLTGDFYDSPTLAKEGETINAEIYVERLAAKITVKKGDSIDETKLNYVVKDIKGKDVTLKFTPTNWAPTGVAKEEYLVKPEFTAAEDWTWTYNDETNSRSYWAEGVYYNDTFDEYYTDGAVTEKLTYVKFGELEGLGAVGENAQYVPEHTTTLQVGEDANGLPTGQENIVANTYALIVGEYAVSGGTDATWFKGEENHTDFYLLLAGMEGEKKLYTIYTKSQLIGLLLHYNKVETVYTAGSDTPYPTNPAATDFDTNFDFTKYLDVKPNEDGKYALAAKEGATEKLYTDAGNTELDITGLDAATNSRNYHYNNGQAYFNALIKHDANGETPIYGVVRNHSYILTITSIENLGAPLDGDILGDEDPIVPNPDELKDHYIKASINVLSWHEKSNDVTL